MIYTRLVASTTSGPVVEKRREKVVFCDSVHIDPYKNAIKTDVFEKAIESGYPQRWRFGNALNQMTFTKPEQCDRTKTDIFGSVLVIRRINANGQNRMFFSPFLYKNGVI